MADSYKRAIELLKSERDWKNIAFNVAQIAPATFVRAVMVDDPDAEAWHQIDGHLREGNKILAVKTHRAAFNTTLRAALAAVEDRMRHG